MRVPQGLEATSRDVDMLGRVLCKTDNRAAGTALHAGMSAEVL